MSFVNFNVPNKPQRKVFIAIPVYSQELDFRTAMSLLHSLPDAEKYNFQIQIVFRAGDALVHKARNVLINEFLATDSTDLFFIDADISWDPGCLGRMMMHPVDFVAGCYRVKSDAVNYFVRPHANKFERNPETGLIEVEAAPTGFMRVSRRAVEAMVVNGGEDAWFADHAAPHLPKMYTLFDFSFENHTLWGEDYIFCRKYRQAGGRVWVDPELMLHHTGKATYSGRFIDALEAMRQQQAMSAVPIKEVLGVMNNGYDAKLIRHCEALISQYGETNAPRH